MLHVHTYMYTRVYYYNDVNLHEIVSYIHVWVVYAYMYVDRSLCYCPLRKGRRLKYTISMYVDVDDGYPHAYNVYSQHAKLIML